MMWMETKKYRYIECPTCGYKGADPRPWHLVRPDDDPDCLLCSKYFPTVQEEKTE